MNRADIEKYTVQAVEEAVAKFPLLLKSAELQRSMVNALTSGAGEMFLWVKFQLSRLCRMKFELDILATLPQLAESDLDELYRDTYNSIFLTGSNATTVAIRTFSWLLYIREPLSADA